VVIDDTRLFEAVATHSVLVTHDKAFSQIPGNKLLIEDWVQENE
jgi:hypothetical protein